MRSSNGGWHGLAGRGFPGLPETSVWFRADDGANSLSHAGSSLIAANLCLAELRSVPEISGAEGFSLFLGERAGWTIVLRDGGPFQADQARRTARRRRRVPAALTPQGQARRAAPRTVLTFPYRTERENVDGQKEADIAGRGPDRRTEKIAGAQKPRRQDIRKTH